MVAYSAAHQFSYRRQMRVNEQMRKKCKKLRQPWLCREAAGPVRQASQRDCDDGLPRTTATSVYSVKMACSRWPRVFVNHLTIFDVSSAPSAFLPSRKHLQADRGFMARFDWLDYTVFSSYLLASLGIGIAFTRGQRSIKDCFLAGRSMGPIVAAVTVLAGLYSEISFLGTPSEVYVHGIGYWLIVLSGFVRTPTLNYVFIPVSYRVKYYSGRRNMVGRVRRMAVEDRWRLEGSAPAW